MAELDTAEEKNVNRSTLASRSICGIINKQEDKKHSKRKADFMEKYFGIGSPLAKLMTLLANTICISLLWLLGSLSIVTVGPSTTAAYYAAMKTLGGETAVFRNYIKSFRENWRQAIVLELFTAVPALVLAGGVFLISGLDSQMPYGIGVAYGGLVFVFLAVSGYVFPLLSYFVFPTGILLKNAVLIAFANMGWTLAAVMVNLVPWMLGMLPLDWTVRLLPLLVALVPGTAILLNGWIYSRIFPKYVQEQ